MPSIANAEQAAAWDGAEGEHWSAHADRYEAASRRYDRHLIAAAHLQPGSAVLDIGCGSGVSSRDAAKVAVHGRVLGIDLSARLLDEARRRSAAEGLTNTEFVQGDAQVHPFPSRAFDVAISRFGTLFFADPPTAFGNIATALRPGGRLALLAWRELAANEWVRLIREALAAGRALPEPTPGRPGAFGLADKSSVHRWLGAAGSGDVETTPLAEPMYLGADIEDSFAFVSQLGLARSLLADLDTTVAAHALDLLRDRLTEHASGDGVLVGSAAWLITAVNQRPPMSTDPTVHAEVPL
jgi:SAM-dependent methyltransferase